ncbi:MAG TPA: ABC transporter ATP-binding protein [Acidimicrobiales bacterium]
MSAVRVSGLTVRYGTPDAPPAVDDIDLSAEAGEVLVVLGPNGAGKTTTVETLEGYRRPSAGQVRVLDLDPIGDHAALTGRMGVMLQAGGVYPMLGPRRVLDLFADYYPDPMGTEELLHLVGLRGAAHTPWRHLSGGEQQRLSLALALIGRPEVAFLDEPTSGVDPVGRVAIRDVVAGLKDQGVSVVLTTHELAEAERMADRIVILAGGRIVLEGKPHELVGSRADGERSPTEVSFGAPPGLDTAALAAVLGQGATAAEITPGRYRVEAPVQPGSAVAAAVTAHLAERGAGLTDLVVGRTLEDVYFDAVGPEAAAQAEDAEPSAGGRRGRRRGRSRR